MRRLHSFAGLSAAIVVTFMAITGAILSLQPALDAATSHSGATTSVAVLAGEVSAVLPNVERMTQSASGTVVAYYSDGATHAAAQIDPATGAVLGAYEPNGFFAFITELHRSLFFGDAGHAVAGIASLAIAVLAVSGMLLLVSRMGGWQRLFAPSKGTLIAAAPYRPRAHRCSGARRYRAQRRLHVGAQFRLRAGRGEHLVLVSLRCRWRHARCGQQPRSARRNAALGPARAGLPRSRRPRRRVHADHQRRARLCRSGDGRHAVVHAQSIWQQIYETIYMLHTGQGALVVRPAARRRRSRPCRHGAHRHPDLVEPPPQCRRDLQGNASWRTADTVILVGSEANTTWGVRGDAARRPRRSRSRASTPPR